MACPSAWSSGKPASPRICCACGERRYGFPEPARDAQGDRVYPREQVDKLRAVRRLMDQGFRPGKIIHLSAEELSRLFEARRPR